MLHNIAPLPLICELMDQLTRVSRHCLALFTKLDIHWGYNNICIKDRDQWKAAFKINCGLFEPMVMFFGLTNAPATFQTMMNDIFCDLINEGYITIYMDDILIHTLNEYKLHCRVVNNVLQVLADHNLFLKPQKCQFKVTSVKYLGVIITTNSIAMDPIKVAGIHAWKVPRTLKEVQLFLGFCNFYCMYICSYSIIMAPLNALIALCMKTGRFI